MTTEEDLAYERSWIGTAEDEADFLDNTDQYLAQEDVPQPSQEDGTGDPTGVGHEGGCQEDAQSWFGEKDSPKTPGKSKGMGEEDWEKLFEDSWAGAGKNQVDSTEDDYESKDDFWELEKEDTYLEFEEAD